MRTSIQTLGALTLLAMMAGACATGPATADRGGDWSLVQPYHHALTGVGGGAILGSILVGENSEASFVSAALVAALQNQQLSLRTPALGPGGIIGPRIQWTTDIAPLPLDVIAFHNERFPRLKLPPAYYGIAYEGLHDTVGNQFRYKVSAHLYSKGAISDWSPVSDNNYSGQFFVARLTNAIQHELRGNEVHP